MERIYNPDARTATASGINSLEALSADSVPKDIFEFYDKMDQDDAGETSGKGKQQVFEFEIVKDQIELLQKRFAKIRV